MDTNDTTTNTTMQISYDLLKENFHLPISQVAKDLGVCATVLKKICRKNGIPRWPHRKVVYFIRHYKN